MTYGTFQAAPGLTWPMKETFEGLDYSIDAAYKIDAGDTITGISVSVKPSGELIPERVSLSGTLITTWLSGGIAGRSYIVQIVMNTAAGRTPGMEIAIPVNPALADWPLADPINPGWGDAVIWQRSDDANFFIIGG